MNKNTTPAAQSDRVDPGSARPYVEVRVNRDPHKVRPGGWIVSDFKREVGVHPSKDLDQVVDGQLVPLGNDDTIEIRGGEEFFTHVPQGGSS